MTAHLDKVWRDNVMGSRKVPLERLQHSADGLFLVPDTCGKH